MEKISIKPGAVNIFRTAQTNHSGQTTETKHSNPFGISFKGNVLQADVFSSSKAKTKEHTGVMDRITEKGRAVKSAIVGGINNFNTELNSRFNNGVNRIISFGKKIGENTKAFWKRANETSYVLDFSVFGENFNQLANKDITEIFGRRNEYSVKELSKHNVGDLETMFKSELGIEG